MSQDLAVLDFQPTKAQRQAKARFWLAAADSLVPPDSMSLAEVCRMSGTGSVEKWWKTPGFVPWFLNKDTARQKLMATADQAVERLVGIMNETDIGPRGRASAAAVVKAAELVLQYAGLQPAKKQEVQYRDQTLAKMGSAQLQQLILGKVRQLVSTMDGPQLRELLGDNVRKLKEEAIDVTPETPETTQE